MCEVGISGASEQKQGNQSGNNYSTTGKPDGIWDLGSDNDDEEKLMNSRYI